MNHLKLALFIFVNSLFFESYAVSNWIFRYPVAILLFSINALWLPLNNIDKVDSYAARFYSGFFFGAIISAYAAQQPLSSTADMPIGASG
jgi:hypothetical protein